MEGEKRFGKKAIKVLHHYNEQADPKEHGIRVLDMQISIMEKAVVTSDIETAWDNRQSPGRIAAIRGRQKKLSVLGHGGNGRCKLVPTAE